MTDAADHFYRFRTQSKLKALESIAEAQRKAKGTKSVAERLLAKATDAALAPNRQRFSTLHPTSVLRAIGLSAGELEASLEAIEKARREELGHRREELAAPTQSLFGERNPKTAQTDFSKFQFDKAQRDEELRRRFGEWKAARGVEEGRKVFFVQSNYGPLIDCLLAKGWRRNDQIDSPFFDLKFTIKMGDLDYNGLAAWQTANQVLGVQAVTAKAELRQTLLRWTVAGRVDTALFFPRTYDLNCLEDHANFLRDFRLSRAVAVSQGLVKGASEASREAAERTVAEYLQLNGPQALKHPQFSLVGAQSLWIVKPAAMSRGRGIMVASELPAIEGYLFSSDVDWIAQKYIERPLLVHNRKVSSPV